MGFNMTLSTVVVFLPTDRHLAVVPGNIVRYATIFFVYSAFLCLFPAPFFGPIGALLVNYILGSMCAQKYFCPAWWLGWFGFNGGSQLAMGTVGDVTDVSR
ncbi:MAG: hypothetical protein JKY06_00055, partial [Alcanivorax sp.]|nr:hypothetical protein [Alcanivorax sp.]